MDYFLLRMGIYHSFISLYKGDIKMPSSFGPMELIIILAITFLTIALGVSIFFLLIYFLRKTK